MTDFYYQLNQSHTNLDNEAYIKKTTDVMRDCLQFQKKKDSLLVVGAGNLSDFDLNYFLCEFSKVYLTDIDTVSVKEALGEHANRSAIKIQQVDYIGLTDTNFYDDFEDLLSCTQYNEVVRFFEDKTRRLNAFRLARKFNQTFDSIYISPIYTQLFYREVEAKLSSLVEKGFPKAFKNKILERLLQSMTEIIERFNKEIVKLLDTKGTLFVASDIFYLSNDAFSRTIRSAINDDVKMSELHREYQKQYGYGLGDFGLESLSEKLQTLQTMWLLWGKTRNHAYAVKFYAMKRDK